jgi:hypothetical protein
MFKKAFTLSALSMALFAGSANASIFLDFEGSTNGALVQNFYNGGTDSAGNVGANYGVTFNQGATVRVDNGRTYLSDVTSISVAGGFELGTTFLFSTYNSRGTNPNTADMSDISARLDTDPDRSYWQILGNTYLTSCDAYPDTYCRFVAGFATVREADSANTISFGPAPWSSTTFARVAIDSLTIGVYPGTFPNFQNLPAPTFIGDTANAEVAEPATVAMLGLGLFGIAAARRRKK